MAGAASKNQNLIDCFILQPAPEPLILPVCPDFVVSTSGLVFQNLTAAAASLHPQDH